MELKKRILVVLPMYGGSLPIGQYCAAALRKLGHSVRVFAADELYPAFQGIKKLDLTRARITALENSFLKFISSAIWSQIQEQKPDLVLALAQAPLDKPILERLRRAGIITVMWFVEDYKVFNYWKWYAPLYDAFAVIQKEPFLSLLREIGQPRAFYLPLAALPDFHKPLELTSAERRDYGADIGFLGAGYPNRRLAFRGLANKDFKIWGSDWEGETVLARNIQRGGERISPEESVKIYNASKININLHSSVDPSKFISGGDFVNPRTFELAAMGAFQLTDKRSLMDELFAADELATFSTMEEFDEKLKYFLNNPQKREEYAAKARKRVLTDHTYEQRMETLLAYIGQNFPKFAAASSGESDALSDLSPELKAGLKELTAKLGLAPDAAFDDIVARIRQRQGELNELETAILFLDEWRKQYS